MKKKIVNLKDKNSKYILIWLTSIILILVILLVPISIYFSQDNRAQWMKDVDKAQQQYPNISPSLVLLDQRNIGIDIELNGDDNGNGISGEILVDKKTLALNGYTTIEINSTNEYLMWGTDIPYILNNTVIYINSTPTNNNTHIVNYANNSFENNVNWSNVILISNNIKYSIELISVMNMNIVNSFIEGYFVGINNTMLGYEKWNPNVLSWTFYHSTSYVKTTSAFFGKVEIPFNILIQDSWSCNINNLTSVWVSSVTITKNQVIANSYVYNNN